MLPRPSQRSIFHIGEEGGDESDDHRSADEPVKNTDTTRILAGRRDHGRQLRKQDSAVDAVGVGLQILVQTNLHHTRASPHSHIVLKQVVVLPPTTTVARRHRRGPCSSFLSACSRCRKELSSKDVYMYRGDQGFCSEECRCQQILADEATEREAMIKKERMRRGLPRHLHHGPRSAMGAAAIGGASRRLVAIAY
ncbi:hypothetical protein BDA96_02G221900 [Sorghum bicolor]|uniref:FLZ-type domain-containing protein n=2 Tax=Sorghum bicolor TaxID=4558 RepID=A0A921RQ31_SORBI|nr:uncharacterized protein LOC8060298 [Sorghum bicolor]EER96772.1 hypothetical protein SORBI_3002G211000 [Sorghum bicolor]KAG0543813.1 hypothetical protein BDA96_02G221600 [Sorghum bicolor]KAG0543817.1 hypothetical protein BDA96_02G221900 [Sorghum bicolor]|eukprot:XP_002460251.1 uncharacterized protein LOC8060298 [Sorghum bicolor]